MTYALVAFDFDGTLADTMPWLESILHDIATQFDFRPPDAETRAQLRGHNVYGILKQLGIPLWKAPAILQFIRMEMTRAIADIKLFPEVAPMLQAVHATGTRLAIVSSNSTRNVARVLGPDLNTLIDDFACGSDVFGKAAKLERLLARHHIDTANAILIGDEIRDIEAAHKVGMVSGAVTWGYNRADVLRAHDPNWLFSSVAALSAHLQIAS